MTSSNPKPEKDNDPDETADFDPLTAPAPEMDRKELRRQKRLAYMREYQKRRNTGRPPGRPKGYSPAKAREAAKPKNHRTVWAPQYRADGTPGPQFALLACPFPEIFFGGARGGGKALPLDEKIVTPTGYRLMGEMAVGDEVHG